VGLVLREVRKKMYLQMICFQCNNTSDNNYCYICQTQITNGSIYQKIFSDDGTQTLGELAINDFNGVTLFSCKTLELPFKDNLKRKSCIPKAAYKVKKRHSLKYGNHFSIS
jgi:hypothetical protein